MDLNPRSEILLKALIERYITDGQPVGSRTLVKQAGLELSPATVRNVMSDLEDLGLISSPHTSAGRVPTALGYRVFVDSLLTVRPLDDGDMRRLQGALAAEQDPVGLLESASRLLSHMTRMAGVVSVPRADPLAMRQIEFLSLQGNRVLVILVTEVGRVHNRVIQTERVYSSPELTEAANFFNGHFTGCRLEEVKRRLLGGLMEEAEAMQRAMRTAQEMIQGMFSANEAEADVVVSGETNLLEIPDLGDTHKLRLLFDAFSAKRDLLHLLDQAMRAVGVQIFIGRESGYKVFEDCSVVTASYRVDGEIVGTLGVVGPTRMPYEHVISVVDVTARLLGGALSAEAR